ncbi:MAG: type II secretion system protein, partial [Smithella sp.]
MFMKKALKFNLPLRREKQNFLHVSKKKGMDSQKGFTLMEVIVTLVLVGILAALGGMGIVQAVKGYVTVRENSATSQKAQMAMARITREIVELNNISASTVSSTVLPITNISQIDKVTGSIVGDRVIEFDAANKTVRINNDTLIDGVSNLTFTYYSDNATWTYGSYVNLLSAVGVNMTLTNPSMTFQTVVAPRNNGNMGGATVPTVATGTVPSSWGINCFVATA